MESYYNIVSSVSARSTDIHSLRRPIMTADRRPSTVTPNVASRRRHVANTMTKTVDHRASSSAVSRSTLHGDHVELQRHRRRRHASTQPPTAVSAVSTWTRNSVDDRRPHTITTRCPPSHSSATGSGSTVTVTTCAL